MRRVLLLAALLGVSLVYPGCKEDDDQSSAASASPSVSRCKRGVERAVKATTTSEATSIYYSECSALFSQPACRDAWAEAGKLPPAEQIPHVATACRKAYCPALTAFAFEACRDDFKSTPEALTRAWPPLFDAILTREAGAASPEVSASMLVLYARLRQLEAAAPAPSASAAPEGSAAAPAGSGTPAPSATAPVASGSSSPPAPSGSAHKGAAKASPLKAKP